MMKSSLIRVNLIFFILVLFIPNLVSAETKTFIKEYTYQASEADSKISSRIVALEQVKRLLLEELGTYLESHTVIVNFQLKKDQITALTAGIVQTQILKEKWDGEKYWVQAKIEADPAKVAKDVDALRKDRLQSANLEDVQKKVEAALKEVDRLKKKLETAKLDQTIITQHDQAMLEIRVADWVKKGDSFRRVSNYKEAIKAYDKAIELDQKYMVAYINRGIAYSGEEDYKKAYEDFSKAIELAMPQAARAYAARGFCYYQELGLDQEAIKDFNKAIQLEPKNGDYYLYRALSYDKLGKNDDALKDFNKAIELDPTESCNYAGRATFFYTANLEQYAQEAINDFTVAIKLEPKNDMYYLLRGDVYIDLNKLKQAVEDYSKAIELNSKGTHAYMRRGVAYVSLGEVKLAISDYTMAIKENPKNAEAYYRRGKIYLNQKEYDQSLFDNNKAVELDPLNSECYMYRCNFYVDKAFSFTKTTGKKKQSIFLRLAIKDCDKAINLDSKNADAYFHRANAFGLIGDFKKYESDNNKVKELCREGVQAIVCDIEGFQSTTNPDKRPKKPEKNAESSSSATTPDKTQRKPAKNVEVSTAANPAYKGIKGIELMNGNVIEGQIVSIDVDIVKIRTKDGEVLSYSFKNEVQRFIKE
jgi:tetratricopeptide (TPR) repeat protein